MHPSSEEHVKVHAAAERSEHGEVSHAQSHMTKDHDSAMITGVAESGIPVVTHKPQSECFYLELLYLSFFNVLLTKTRDYSKTTVEQGKATNRLL